MKIDISLFYAAALVLNPGYYTRYIEFYWLKKWRAPALIKIKKLWEKYREVIISILTTIFFSYENQNQAEPREFNIFNRITLSLRSVTKPANKTSIRIIIRKNRTNLARREFLRDNIKTRRGNASLDSHL